MKRQEYLQALVPAVIAWRRALRWTTLITVPLNFGFALWSLHLAEAHDQYLERKVAIGFILITASNVAIWKYVGSAFSRNSPVCRACGKHVKLLQRRAVWTSRNCAFCKAEMFEA
jgi:hypothetical protein